MKKKISFKITIALLIASVLIMTSCIPTTGVVIAPTLTTTIASSVTTTGAESGGNITANGGATITASGIVWGTSANPTIALATKTVTNPVITTGAFTGTITSLIANTTYYVRAYATNSAGTGYGTQISFVSTATSTSGVPAVFSKMYGCTVTADAAWIYIHGSGLPDHKSPYYKNTVWESTRWISDTHSGFIQNPNKIDSFYYTFKIPRNPVAAATHTALGTATLGMAVNGVPIFNQYAAGNSPIVIGQAEAVSFDLYGGHPAPTSDYHYHIEPTYITATKGSDALVGFLLDGFPVYGPVENGVTITNADLDAYHGHTTATADYPGGIYHYHTTAASPYINGNGYYGTSGTWTRQ